MVAAAKPTHNFLNFYKNTGSKIDFKGNFYTRGSCLLVLDEIYFHFFFFFVKVGGSGPEIEFL